MKSSTEPFTIAVIADLHCGPRGSIPQRRCEIADILLKRAVRRLNRLIHPNITLVLGDLLNDANSVGSQERLAHIRSILDQLDAPYIAIPGNHDPAPDVFYRTFRCPGDIEDIGGVRFLPFVDRQETGYNASRHASDIARFRKARENHGGPIVALQHVCLFPPGQSDAPYNYTNASAIITAMDEAGVDLSLSGHYHSGTEDIRDGNTIFINAPALSEAPFPFLVVVINRGQVQTQKLQLLLPENSWLIDSHLHTQLAYCNDNMTVASAIDLAKDLGLAGIGFAEHSGQLYFDSKQYWDGAWMKEGMAGAKEADNRMPDYRALQQTYANDTVRFGLEVDCDCRGDLLLKSDDRTRFDHLIGAIHGMTSLTQQAPSAGASHQEFLFLLDRLLANRIDVLAHPFRVFRRNEWPAPASLFQPTARLLLKHNTAAEINFHTNEPPIEFIKTCLDMGVRFTFASDAHDLSEIGDFVYHLALLRDAGFSGHLSNVLAPQFFAAP